MDFFGFVRDNAKGVLKTAANLTGLGPALAAIESFQTSSETIQHIREHGDSLRNLSMDVGELVCVAQNLLPAAKRTNIIAAGLQTVVGMQVLCGFTNEATRGETYSEGGREFNDVADTLESATPTEDWLGIASEAYAAANRRQYDRAKAMVDADFAVSGALSAEAGAVNNTRRILNNGATQMGLAIMPALLAKTLGGKRGEGAAIAIETAAVGTALPTCSWYLKDLNSTSARMAESIEQATLIYEEVAEGGYPTWM